MKLIFKMFKFISSILVEFREISLNIWAFYGTEYHCQTSLCPYDCQTPCLKVLIATFGNNALRILQLEGPKRLSRSEFPKSCFMPWFNILICPQALP